MAKVSDIVAEHINKAWDEFAKKTADRFEQMERELRRVEAAQRSFASTLEKMQGRDVPLMGQHDPIERG